MNAPDIFLKKVPASQSMSVACERSRHIMVERKCAAEVWGQHAPEQTGSTSEASDEAFFEEILGRCNVFCQHNPVNLSKEYFWQHIRVQSSGGSERDQQKEFVAFNEYEQSMNDFIIGGIVPMEQFDLDFNTRQSTDLNEHGDDDSDCITEASSDASSIDNEDNEENQVVDYNELSADQLAERMNDTLKSNGMKRKSSCKKVSVVNMFQRGADSLKKSIKQKRSKKLLKAVRKKQFVNHAVKYFREMMAKRRLLLQKCLERSANKEYVYEQSRTRTRYKEIMKLRANDGKDRQDHISNAA